MAPLHIQLLQALGRVVDIHVYVLNPCQEHWFELIDRRRLAHLARSGRDQGFEVGNRLLAAWGRQTQSHVDLLVDSCGLDAEDDAEFEPHPGSSLLAQLHNAVLELTELAPGSLQLAPDDRSIELQVCHSLTRELEVLHNHLLGLFVQAEEGHGAPLAPSQVLVVVPDLVAAAPLIDAIFGTVPRQRRIAYTVSGRPRSTVNSAARALLALLGLMASRCNAADVFSLLQLPLVARRFGLDEVALQQIHTWLLASGFHWALDGPHSAGLGVASDGRHTLAQAVARLFLGYASPALVEAPLQVSLNADLGTDLLPAGNAQGLAALPLGALWQFSQHLQALQQTCSQAHTPAVWAERLHQVLQDFMLAEGDELSDLRELRDVITALAEEQQSGAPEQPLSLAVMRAALQHSLDDPARGGVPTGQVTFSSISSLRSLPFEVVCVIGLNDGAFPTTPRPHEFDLMALAPRRGDRQRRSDERNLFLDLLLAARRSLYLSHSGRSVFDNAPLPPSVLVSELLDVLLPAIATDPASAASLARARQRLVVEHPLQPFSLQAFARDGDPRLRSFDGPLCAALQHGLRSAPLVEPRRVAPTRRLEINFGSHVDTDPDSDDEPPAAEPLAAFFSAPLAAPGPAWRSVSLQQLQAFFRNPCRSLLRQRLGISLLREPDTLQDDEPFLPDWAGRQSLQQRVLPALLAGASDQAVARLARAGPEQPGGDLGAQQLQAELRALRDFANQVQAACAAPVLPTHHVELSFDLDGETWTLQNSYSALRADGQTIWKFDNTRAADYVQSWLAHLLLCAAPAPGVLAQTAGLSRDGHFQFSPCGPAYALLHELLGLYRQGLCQPLHFFPKSSWVYIRSNHNLDKAAATWRTSSARPYAESADPAYQLAFRGQSEPLDAAFQALAQTVFNPLLQHLHDSRVLN